MKARKLTKAVVDGVEARERIFRVYDAELKGLCLQVSPSGDRRWQIEYRPHPGGRGVAKKRTTLGPTHVLTPDQARKAAQALLAEAAKGGDPARERLAKRRDLTVGGLIDLYEAEGCVVQRGQRQGQPMRSASLTLAALRNHAVPLIGTRRLGELSSVDIERMARAIASGKTFRDARTGSRGRSIVHGGDGAARRVVRTLSSVFGFAIRRGLMTANPCSAAAVRKADGRRERYLSLEEIARLGSVLDQMQEEGINRKALDIVRLLLLTGARSSEISALRWSEVNLEFGRLELGTTKTGRSLRPLASAAQAFLATLPRYAGTPFVFPASRGSGHFQGTKKIWREAARRADLNGGVVIHSLRHSVAASGVGSGEGLLLVGNLLGHRDPRSTAVYSHVAPDPAARAANAAVGPIAAALSGKRPAPVVPLKKSAGK